MKHKRSDCAAFFPQILGSGNKKVACSLDPSSLTPKIPTFKGAKNITGRLDMFSYALSGLGKIDADNRRFGILFS